jgi:hypothetical protein
MNKEGVNFGAHRERGQFRNLEVGGICLVCCKPILRSGGACPKCGSQNIIRQDNPGFKVLAHQLHLERKSK